jgi:hypothetical protein
MKLLVKAGTGEQKLITQNYLEEKELKLELLVPLSKFFRALQIQRMVQLT